jgi:hypothetical protein
MNDEGEEWELSTTYKEGATAHQSFADYLIWHVHHPRAPSPDPADLAKHAASATNGNTYALTLLAELDADRAGQTAVALLNDVNQPWFVRAGAADTLAWLTATGAADETAALFRHDTGDDASLAPFLLSARAIAGDEAAVAELRRTEAVIPKTRDGRLARRSLAQLRAHQVDRAQMPIPRGSSAACAVLVRHSRRGTCA